MNIKSKNFILFLLSSFLLTSCKLPILLNSKGMLGQIELNLFFEAVELMLIIVIPVFIMIIFFSFKYRASNKNLKYNPHFYHNSVIELFIWSIPIIIILILGYITWVSTHELDPYKSIMVANSTPLEVDVVALDWKWLFIYPKERIATVNYLQFPVNTEVKFKLTADAPMNAFQIPQLGTQIYAMAGMQTKLSLVANQTGEYYGRSMNYSGRGYSGMEFKTIVSTRDQFNTWISKVRQNNNKLYNDEYNELAKPSENNKVTTYGDVKPYLFKNIIMKFMMPNMENLNEDHSNMKSMS